MKRIPTCLPYLPEKWLKHRLGDRILFRKFDKSNQIKANVPEAKETPCIGWWQMVSPGLSPSSHTTSKASVVIVSLTLKPAMGMIEIEKVGSVKGELPMKVYDYIWRERDIITCLRALCDFPPNPIKGIQYSSPTKGYWTTDGWIGSVRCTMAKHLLCLYSLNSENTPNQE